MSTRNLPYGYTMEMGIIKADETEAKYVRMIFDLRMDGMGVYAIGKMLYDNKIPFFDDTRDKAIKKASAILYKPIYAGDKNVVRAKKMKKPVCLLGRGFCGNEMSLLGVLFRVLKKIFSEIDL